MFSAFWNILRIWHLQFQLSVTLINGFLEIAVRIDLYIDWLQSLNRFQRMPVNYTLETKKIGSLNVHHAPTRVDVLFAKWPEMQQVL